MKTDLVEIFQTIRAEMQPYATMGFNARTNSDAAYDLWKEPGFVDSIEMEERHFAGVEIKDDYVDFYFSESKSIFEPSLKALLNGETNFHIKELDEALLKQISEALAAGFKQFKQNEWV